MSKVLGFAKDNKGTIGIGIGSAVLGGTMGFVAGRATTRTKKSRRKRTTTRRKKRGTTRRRTTTRKSKKRRNKKRYYPEPRGRKYSRRKIRKTRNGQPYIILSSGRARFIKRSSARMSRRRKGGRY